MHAVRLGADGSAVLFSRAELVHIHQHQGLQFEPMSFCGTGQPGETKGVIVQAAFLARRLR